MQARMQMAGVAALAETQYFAEPVYPPKVEEVSVKPEKRTLDTYDFDAYEKKKDYTKGLTHDGAIQIHGHNHICALFAVSGSFTTSAFKARIAARGEKRYNHYGEPLTPLSKMSVEDLMMLDMDYLMSTIHDKYGGPNYLSVELFTNDKEDERWLKFLERCPYAHKVYEVPSKMDKYNVQCWIIALKDPKV